MIETERLTLRPWIETDREPFVDMFCDPAVSEWLGGPRTREQGLAAFAAMPVFWAEHGYGQLAIAGRADGALLGRVGCRRQPPEWKHPMMGEVEIGWLLARQAWGHGYASEAATAVLPWGFESLGVATIFSWTARINHRSEAVMRRIGMTRAAERDFEHPDLAADNPLRAHVVYRMEQPA